MTGIAKPSPSAGSRATTMRLRLVVPTRVVVERPVKKIVAEAQNGSFGLLPRHIDFCAALVPGVLLFVDQEDEEHVYGIDAGMLLKCGRDVLLSTRHAIAGRELEDLRATVRDRFLRLDERERSARSALARLEAGVVRRFIDLQEQAR